MDTGYWRQRWAEGRTGWHQDAPTPLLLEHWSRLGVAPGARVFVPLAGKSHDMQWLAAQGYRVLGVELSPLAVEQFFSERGVSPRVSTSRYGVHHEAGGIELICGDAFELDTAALADCHAAFDRAALVALPPPLRARYADELYRKLPAGCRALLLTLEYPQHEKAGPPFSVDETEVRTLFAGGWSIDRLHRRDILATQPSFVADGVTRLAAAVYRMERRVG